jgi:hypothetical protein
VGRIRRYAALTPEQREERERLLRSSALDLSRGSPERELLSETIFAGVSRLWELEKGRATAQGRCPHCGLPLGGGDDGA